MAWKSILPEQAIPDAKEDAKRADSFGSFRISEKAVYMNGQTYLPLSAVREAKLYATRLNTHGCCGLGLPVWNVLLYYGEEKPLRLMHEKKEKAEEALRLIAARNPAIAVTG